MALWSAAAWALGLILIATPVAAQDAPILELRNLAATPPPAPIALDRAALAALPQHVVRTHTEFTDGLVAFAGPRASDVVALIGAGPARVARMVALNDYAVEIPLDDFSRHGVILALTMDGEPMSPRGKGPIWVIYPIDGNPVLDDPLYNSRMIWQLAVIELR